MKRRRIHGCKGWHESYGDFNLTADYPYLIRTVFSISCRADNSGWYGRSAVVCGEGF